MSALACHLELSSVSALACHLELSGLTEPTDVCGCGFFAVDHRAWKHREKHVAQVEDAQRIVDLLASLDRKDEEIAHLRAEFTSLERGHKLLDQVAARHITEEMRLGAEIAAAWDEHPQGRELQQLGVSLADLVKGLNDEIAAMQAENRAALPVPSYVPATCENVRAAATSSAPTGMFVVVLPPDVLEVGQALHDVLGIFWLNPERDASRWRAKDAVQHVAAGCSHALQHIRGRVTDPDTGRPHLHLAGARMLLAVAQLRAGKGGV